jgi:hypothetical protein
MDDKSNMSNNITQISFMTQDETKSLISCLFRKLLYSYFLYRIVDLIEEFLIHRQDFTHLLVR